MTTVTARRIPFRSILLLLVGVLLAWSFSRSSGWMQLCGGLAMFLFGMQLLEEGLRQLAGGRLERWLARSTETPFRSLLFGIGGTMLLQSSTLVSLLTIAFISTGLIQLAGGIAIIFGANLGATSGIWLLAMAGHDFSLSKFALPLLVYGVLAGFNGPASKAAGRVALGVAFIFLGIDQIKVGFAAFGDFDMTQTQGGGIGGTLLFATAGMAATLVLQSSHATLMLTLAALASGQLQIPQGFAIAIGANLGSSISTAVVGMLGGNRGGQRLALAHAIFNGVTATLALLLLPFLTWLVQALAQLLGFGDNALLRLALFHTLFNASGVMLFWPWQKTLARWLERWLPEAGEPEVLTAQPAGREAAPVERTRARHLADRALESVDAATAAVALELRHLARLSVEVICRALSMPPGQLADAQVNEAMLDARPQPGDDDAETLYQHHVKGVYADLLSFMGKLELPLDEEHQRFWQHEQMVALLLVNAVKDAKHLQKNLQPRLNEVDSPLRDAYIALRRHLFRLLHALYELGSAPPDPGQRATRLAELEKQADEFEASFRQRLFLMVRRGELDGLQTGSLMNDLGYAERIFNSLRQAMSPVDEPESLQRLRALGATTETAAAPE
jgi:phosphate:Na+ symporter